MATLLALETSGDACSVAVWRSGQITEIHEVTPRSHTQVVLPMVDSVLAQTGVSLSSLDAIAFGCGPGSFTGLRVCASVVQGLAVAANLPCLPVSSLAALAHSAFVAHKLIDGQRILACVDARMDEVYWCGFELVNSLPQALIPEQLSAPEAVTLDGDFTRVGSGWRYGERLPVLGTAASDAVASGAAASGADTELLPHASSVAVLGEQLLMQGGAVTVENAVPRYLRDEVAWR